MPTPTCEKSGLTREFRGWSCPGFVDTPYLSGRGGVRDAPRSAKHYPSEYRQEIVALVRSGRSPEAVARDFRAVGAHEGRRRCPGERLDPQAGFGFVRAYRAVFPIRAMCRVLVSPRAGT